MRTDQARRLKELERENAQLKKLVTELSLDQAILKEALSQVPITRSGCGGGRVVLGLLGIQSQTLAHLDGRLNVGAVSARRHERRKPIETQVAKEI